mgnify:CR=1 FL=1
MKLGAEEAPEGTLFIIEAAGKREALLKTLNQIGVKGVVFSTNGHVLSSPKSLWPSFIDAKFRELRREPINPDLCTDMKIAARKAKRIIVATDPDEEGHVIATDVANMLSNHHHVLRGLFYGFDALSVRKGMNRLTRVNDDEAVPGNVRRVIDRWIGSTFSDPKKGVSVGRILTGALSLVKRKPVELGFLPVDIPASDGGEPFRGDIPITRENKHLLEKYMLDLGKLDPLDVDYKEIDTSGLPQDHIDTILSISLKTGESIKVVQERLQRFYERQHISYPRTDAHSYNHKSIDFAKKLASHNHVEIKSDLYAINDQEHAHESIHLLREIELDREIQYGEDQEILTHIGRMMIKAGQPIVKIMANASSLPFWARDIEWKRTVSMNNGWLDDKAPPPFKPVMYSSEQAGLKFLHDNDLGRPGTMVSHAVRLTSKGLLTEDFKLTGKGEKFLKHSPEVLFEERVHALLEYAGKAKPPEGVDPESVTVEDRVIFALKESGLLKDAEEKQKLKKIEGESLREDKVAALNEAFSDSNPRRDDQLDQGDPRSKPAYSGMMTKKDLS